MSFVWAEDLTKLDAADIVEIRTNVDSVVDNLVCHAHNLVYHSNLHGTYHGTRHVTYHGTRHTAYCSGQDGTDYGSDRGTYNSSHDGTDKGTYNSSVNGVKSA